jgi:hypothetical protein
MAGLAACATTGEPQRDETLVGRSELQVIERLGPPHHAYDVGDVRFLSWTFERRVAYPDMSFYRPCRSPLLGMRLPGSYYGSQAVVQAYQCTIVVELDRVETPGERRGENPPSSYVVRAARQQGNGC